MLSFIEEILKRNCDKKEKKAALEEIELDLFVAKGVLDETFKYCPQCKEYYMKESFFNKKERKDTKVCIYVDPINSGGNDYANGFADITYEVCPKGHKVEVCRKERRY